MNELKIKIFQPNKDSDETLKGEKVSENYNRVN